MSHGVAVIGSGAVATDMMIKVLRVSETLRMVAMADDHPDSDSLARARRFGVASTAGGLTGLLALPEFAEVELVFDASPADARRHHDAVLAAYGRTVVVLTPSDLGPAVVPPVNADAHLRERTVTMVSGGAQAGVPVVAAVRRVTPVAYGEIVSSAAVDPATRADPAEDLAGDPTEDAAEDPTEDAVATARAIETVGGAERGAAHVLPGSPERAAPTRDTVRCLCPDVAADRDAIAGSVARMVAQVGRYAPGYRLAGDIRFDEGDGTVPALGRRSSGLWVTVPLEITGAGHHLSRYAGHDDLLASAALRTGERLVAVRVAERLTGLRALPGDVG